MPKDPRKSDDRSGYRERLPDNEREAREPGAKKPPNPDIGGLDRDPEQDGTNEPHDNGRTDRAGAQRWSSGASPTDEMPVRRAPVHRKRVGKQKSADAGLTPSPACGALRP